MKRFPYIHLILFIITFISTLVAGSLFQKGINIIAEPWRIIEGLPFSLSLMIILLGHELSHYIASKIHHTEATLPYFIPAPSLIGTFGAFIKMKSPIVTRKALIDIGASGPIAGFALSVAASSIGLKLSSVVSVSETKGGLGLGDSILFSLLSRLILGITPDGYDILLHPIAFAGWIGLFVTSLNLIPVGQLDGGHIAYAFLGTRHVLLSRILVGLLLVLGIFFWEGWLIWAVLMVILGLRHPPVIYWEMPLDRRRILTGVFAMIIFIITFIPEPFKIW
ncbi:MAG: site-2 protease family protein [Thermodesulfovibrionales bacterium]